MVGLLKEKIRESDLDEIGFSLMLSGFGVLLFVIAIAILVAVIKSL